jgi:hypothetical protein
VEARGQAVLVGVVVLGNEGQGGKQSKGDETEAG